MAVPCVLLADDSPVARRAVEAELRALGLDVLVHEGAAGVLSRSFPGLACAVLDLDLGDGWGTDVARHLRREAPGLPVAFFTSDPTDEARAMGPVFDKPEGLERAMAWVRAVTGAT